MWKLILLVLILWLVITVVKRMLANSNTSKTENPTSMHEAGKSNAENMVQCTACQVHLPRSEAFLVEGKFYCSKAHIEHKSN